MRTSTTVAPIAAWLSQVGRLRAWERASANKEALAYSPEQLKVTVAALVDFVTRELTPPLSPADIETILLMSLDVSAIFRGVSGAGQLIKNVEHPSAGWQLLVRALKGASYTELDKAHAAMDRANNAVRGVADVVSAYVSNHAIRQDQLPSVIRGVHAALARPDEPIPTEPSRPEPAVPIRRSITPDFLISLEDGKKYKTLTRHLRVKYNMSPDEYRAKWGLAKDYPMVAPNYAAKRSAMAKSTTLGVVEQKVRA